MTLEPGAIGAIAALIAVLGGVALYLLGMRHGEREADAEFDRAWAAKTGEAEEPAPRETHTVEAADFGDRRGDRGRARSRKGLDRSALPTATTAKGPVRLVWVVTGVDDAGEDE